MNVYRSLIPRRLYSIVGIRKKRLGIFSLDKTVGKRDRPCFNGVSSLGWAAQCAWKCIHTCATLIPLLLLLKRDIVCYVLEQPKRNLQRKCSAILATTQLRRVSHPIIAHAMIYSKHIVNYKVILHNNETENKQTLSQCTKKTRSQTIFKNNHFVMVNFDKFYIFADLNRTIYFI